MREYVFEDDLVIGQKYEDKFVEYLKKLGVGNIERAPKDKQFHEWDIKTPAGTYEIKYDRWMESTGNICIETHSCLEKSSLGWFFKTKADRLIVFYNETEFVFIDMVDLQNAWFDHPHLWKKQKVKQTWGTTICWLADTRKIEGLKPWSINEDGG